MSPRAASRLEAHGFDPVYDYLAGKADWLAAGLPSERSEEIEPRVIDHADPHPVTCPPTALASSLPAGHIVVVDEDRTVLGEITDDTERPAGVTAETVMKEGPSTVRADEPVEPLDHRMADHDVSAMLVTTPDGHLLGIYGAPPASGAAGQETER